MIIYDILKQKWYKGQIDHRRLNSSDGYWPEAYRGNNFAALCAFSIPENNTWIGLVSGDSFQSNTNWSSGRLPNPCDDIIIPAGVNVTMKDGQKTMVKSVTVKDGGNLNVENAAVLKIKEN